MLLNKIINHILVFEFLCFGCINSAEKKSKKTKPVTEKSELVTKKNVLLIFNAGTVLIPFSIYDVKFPIKEERPGVVIDGYENRYKPYENVTNVLRDLKQKGFRLYALMNSHVKDEDWSETIERFEMQTSNLPTSEDVEKMFNIFGWENLFEEIIHHWNRIEYALKRIEWYTHFHFRNMVYFDDNEKYDKVINRFGVTRFIAENGINYTFVKNMLSRCYDGYTNRTLSF